MARSRIELEKFINGIREEFKLIFGFALPDRDLLKSLKEAFDANINGFLLKKFINCDKADFMALVNLCSEIKKDDTIINHLKVMTDNGDKPIEKQRPGRPGRPKKC